MLSNEFLFTLWLIKDRLLNEEDPTIISVIIFSCGLRNKIGKIPSNNKVMKVEKCVLF